MFEFMLKYYNRMRKSTIQYLLYERIMKISHELITSFLNLLVIIFCIILSLILNANER